MKRRDNKIKSFLGSFKKSTVVLVTGIAIVGVLFSGLLWATTANAKSAALNDNSGEVELLAEETAAEETATDWETATEWETATPDESEQIETSTPIGPDHQMAFFNGYVRDNDKVVSIDCDGKDMVVTGNNNTLTLTGSCSSLTVRGNANTITLDTATSVMDYGNENMIMMPEQTLEPTPEPTQAPTDVPTATEQPVVMGQISITDNDKVMTINCEGAAVTVYGNNNMLTLTGACSNLMILGNGNQITLQSAAMITDKGNGNLIK